MSIRHYLYTNILERYLSFAENVFVYDIVQVGEICRSNYN